MNEPRPFVFLAVNASYSHSSLAAWCLKEMVDPRAWAWHTVEATTGDAPDGVLERIVALQPAVVGATLYLFNRAFVTAVLAALRHRCPGTAIIVGGPECLGDNRRLLDAGVAQVAVRGEGERALPALLDAWDTPAKWRDIPGVCTGRGAAYHDGGQAGVVEDLDALPSFYGTALSGFGRPFVQLETSRGCANGCLFCTSRETRVRVRSLERVRADLEAIRRHGVSQVRVVDRTFNAGAGRALSLVRLFRDEFPELRFHLELDPARVSDRFADALAAAGPGRFHVEAGVQSLGVEVCAGIGRRGTPGRTLDGLRRLCSRREIAVHVDLIAGLPGGTLAGLKEDLLTLVRLRPDEIQLERLKLLPGTPLADRPRSWGLEANPEPPYEVRRTATMTADDLREADRLRRFLDGFYNTAALRDSVLAAVEADPGFLELAGRELGGGVGEGRRAPLVERFRELHRVLPAGANAAARGLEREWIRRGFSLRFGLVPARPWKQPLPPGCELVEGDERQPQLRRWWVQLDRPHLVCYGTGDNGARRVVAIYRM